jgi:hypothetical protein
MRKAKRARIKPSAALFAVAVPAVVLFVLFSLLPYGAMVGQWPLGIGQEEVMAYQKVFDRRPGQHGEGLPEAWVLTAEGSGDCLGRSTLAAAGGTASMEVQALPGSQGGILLLADAPFGPRQMDRMALVPADLSSLTVLYVQSVAEALGLASPAVDVLRLGRCGRTAAPWLLQQVISKDHVLRHARYGSVLLGPDGRASGPDSSVLSGVQPQVQDLDTALLPAFGLLAWAGQRQDLLNGSAGAVRDGITGGISPLYRMPYGDAADSTVALARLLRAGLARPTVQARVQALAHELLADSAQWAMRFAAIDSAQVPVLANGRNLGLVQASVDRVRTDFMARLFHPRPEALFGAPRPQAPVAATALDPWLAQFRSGDTLRFVRGKYLLDHDMEVPQGLAVVLERGSRWNLAPGVDITIHGEFHARGTEVNPVFIRPVNDSAAYGSITVSGNGETRVRMRGVRISGGSEQRAQGLQRPGMLSFVGCQVVMERCTVGPSAGPASVSVQRGRCAIADSWFSGAKGAAVKLMGAESTVERCTFTGGNGAASWGVMADAAGLLLRGSTFQDLPGGGLHAGAGSKAAVLSSTLAGCGTAVLATEGSEVDVDGCTLNGNATAFTLREGRWALGTAKLVLHANTLTGNTREEDAQGGKLERSGVAWNGATWDPEQRAAH